MTRHQLRGRAASQGEPVRPPASEDNTGPWQGMRPPYANPSAVPQGQREVSSTSPVPYRDVLAGLPAAMVFLAGVWLVVCSWLIEHPATALGVGSAVPDIVAGVLLTVFGGAKAVSPFRAAWAGWAALVVGALLIVAPFALGYRGGEAGAAMTNDIVVGAVVMALSIAALALGARWGGHARATERESA